MPEFKIGAVVKVPCSIKPGAFQDERLITIKTDDEEITGFVKADQITETNKDEGYILGTIVSEGDGFVIIQIPASLFTGASGRASVRENWAVNHFQLAAAT